MHQSWRYAHRRKRRGWAISANRRTFAWRSATWQALACQAQSDSKVLEGHIWNGD